MVENIISIDTKITDSAKDILNNYDADDLLHTIPHDYKLNPIILKTYKNKIKSTTPTSITLSTQTYNWLTALSENNNVPFSLIFNFLIETVADCGKVNTKNIKRALDCYYYAVNHDRSLFSQILDKYVESGFYDEETGLDEEGIAYFLTVSEDGRKLIKSIDNFK